MKYTAEIRIALPRNKVIELFDNSANLYKWQPGLKRVTQLEGKPGGAFGSYGWSGEAAGRIFDTMEHIYKMKMSPDGPLMLKAGWVGGGIQAAQEYGKNLCAML